MKYQHYKINAIVDIQGWGVQAAELHPRPIFGAVARNPEPQHIQLAQLPQRDRSQKCLRGDAGDVLTFIDAAVFGFCAPTLWLCELYVYL